MNHGALGGYDDALSAHVRDDEEVIWRANPDGRLLAWREAPTTAINLVFIAFAITFVWLSPDSLLFLAVGSAFAAISAWGAAAPLRAALAAERTHYLVTTDRVIISIPRWSAAPQYGVWTFDLPFSAPPDLKTDRYGSHLLLERIVMPRHDEQPYRYDLGFVCLTAEQAEQALLAIERGGPVGG